MNEEQRIAVGQQIADARRARGWSQEVLATEAGVAPNTIGSMEAGRSTRPGSLGKVMKALGIEPAAEVAYREGLPADVHLVTEVVAMWLADMPEADRPKAVLDLMRHLGTPPTGQ